MIRFPDPPVSVDPAQTSVAAGADLGDALALFGQQHDCHGCISSVAATAATKASTIDQIRKQFNPLAKEGPVIRPSSNASDLFRRGRWTEVDIDAQAQRLRSVRMPSVLMDAQRLLAVNDLRVATAPRPVIAIALWASFAHPVVRAGAHFAGARDGLTAEIALAVHPDRYVLVDRDRTQGFTFVVASPDIITTELTVLALRESRASSRGPGPWEDPLVQAATDLDLGVRIAEEIDIDALVSPTLSAQQRLDATALLVQAAELIGVATSP